MVSKFRDYLFVLIVLVSCPVFVFFLWALSVSDSSRTSFNCFSTSLGINLLNKESLQSIDFASCCACSLTLSALRGRDGFFVVFIETLG